MPIVTIDFETRSHCDLVAQGLHNYARHPTTEVLCVAWKVDGGKTQCTTPQEAAPILRALAKRPDVLFAAWQAEFELEIFNNVFLPDTPLRPSHMRCSMARALACALPGSLGECATTLGVDVRKDYEGAKLMRIMCKPDKNGEFVFSADRLSRLMEYCKTDVDAEHAIDEVLPALSIKEQTLWELTVKINANGVRVDVPAIQRIMEVLKVHNEGLLAEISDLTDGKVTTGKQVQRILAQFKTWGLQLEDLTKESITDALNLPDLTPQTKRLLELRAEGSMSSTAKYEKMLTMAGEDERVRGLLKYHGASTGRFCMDGSHEVLTPQGWVRIDKWAGEPIASWDAELGLIKFETVCVHAFPFSGKLIDVNEHFISMQVTPEHRLPIYSSRGLLSVKLARDIDATETRIMPVSGVVITKDVCGIETRIRVMAQADGHFVTDTRSGRGLVFGFVKARKIQRCKELLNRAGISYSYRDYGKRSVIKIAFRDCPAWLWDFRSKVFDITTLGFYAFIDELRHWDSYIEKGGHSFVYYTTVKENAEIAATIAHLTGNAATIAVKSRNSMRVNWADCYKVTIRRTIKTRFRTHRISEKIANGVVYCPFTSTGYFLTRHRGLIHVTGNSGAGIQIQNFPRPTLKNAERVAEVLAWGDYDFAASLYPSVNEAASSALRSMLIANHTFFAADYSAIEARVLSWAAGDVQRCEEWRSGKDLYKLLAARVYGINVRDVVDSQRQLGKVGVLGCFAADTLVLTNRGWVRIIDVTDADKLWDGAEWVTHGGVICQGKRKTIEMWGIDLTPDHQILIRGRWLPSQEVLENARYRVSALKMGYSSWLGMTSANVGVLRASLCRVLATGLRRTGWMSIILDAALPLVATLVPKNRPKPRNKRCIGGMRIFCPILPTALDCWGVLGRVLIDAIIRSLVNTCTMGGAGYMCKKIGVGIRPFFSNMLSPSQAGITRIWNWTAQTLITAIAKVIYVSSPGKKTSTIAAPWPNLRQKSPRLKVVYDILNSGPNNCFTISSDRGPLVAHNCGYGMGHVKFIDAAKGYGVVVDSKMAQRTVEMYRESNPLVVQFWRNLETSAKEAIRNPGLACKVGPFAFKVVGSFLYLRLPSGRLLRYYRPKLALKQTKFGLREEIRFVGVYQGKPVPESTYSGKLAENAISATARDIMTDAMLALDTNGFEIVLTVHDEIVVDCPDSSRYEEFISIMERVPAWANGLPVKVGAWHGARYRK